MDGFCVQDEGPAVAETMPHSPAVAPAAASMQPAASALPYSMIQPTKWAAPVPALSQPPPAAHPQAPGPGSATASAERCMQAASDAQMPSPSVSTLPHAHLHEPDGCSPMEVDMQPVEAKGKAEHHISVIQGKQGLHLLGPLQTLASDAASGGSLPVPHTPAVAEELRARLHHCFSLTNSELAAQQQQQQQLQRPGSSSSEGISTVAAARVTSAPLNGKHAPGRIILEGPDLPNGNLHGSDSGVGALGRWAAKAVAKGLSGPVTDLSSCEQLNAPAEGCRPGSAGMLGTPVEPARCSPVEGDSDQSGPQVIKVAAQ